MENEKENWHAHLLKPIRDLTKNWDIDVAAQLADYLAEIEKVTISFDDGSTTMNFTEAAFVIQGSTCVYSKKVEYLYNLVYQTLNLLSSKQKSHHSVTEKDASHHGNAEEEEFLTLDDIEVGKNIDLDEKASKQKAVSAVPRTPMSLVPLQDCEKSSNLLYSVKGEVLGSKMDYRMNTGSIHSSGALLLEPMNHIRNSTSLQKKLLLTPKAPTGYLYSNAATGEPVQPMEMDCSSLHDPAPAGEDAWSDNDAGGFTGDLSPIPNKSRQARGQSVVQSEPDVWAPLDPHQLKKNDEKTLRKGNTLRPPKRFQSTSKKRKSRQQIQPPELPLRVFTVASFYSQSASYPKQSWKAPLYPESEAQYWTEFNARKRKRKGIAGKLKQAKKDYLVVQHLEIQENDDDDGYGGNYVEEGGGMDDSVDDKVESVLAGITERLGEGGDIWHTHPPPAEVDPIAFNVSAVSLPKTSNLIQSYEELVRDYVEQALAQAQTYALETDLSKRVQDWDDKIKPQLVAVESRPTFDIHMYGSRMIEDLDQTMEQTNSEWIPFGDVVGGKSHYDICRTFSAMLQLANNNNIEISTAMVNGTQEGDISVKLISKKLVFDDILGFRAPSVNVPHSDDQDFED